MVRTEHQGHANHVADLLRLWRPRGLQRPMNRRCNDMQQWSVWRHDEGRCVRISVELTGQRQSFDCEDRVGLYSGLVQSGGAEGAPEKLLHYEGQHKQEGE